MLKTTILILIDYISPKNINIKIKLYGQNINKVNIAIKISLENIN